MPTDRLTMRSTIFDRSEKENTAAAVMLTIPASVVASRMENSGESILGLGKNATKLQIKAQTGYFSKRPRCSTSAMGEKNPGVCRDFY